MKILKMPKNHLDLFVSVLPAFGELFAPIRRGSGIVFERPSTWADVQLSYPRTILPPKKLFLPPQEATFAFSPEEGYQDLSDENERPRVLLGVHSYDICALNLLDLVFAQGKYRDPYYIARRANTAIVGMDFQPDDKHFANSMGSDFASSGFDVFLSDIGEDYLVLVGTSRGDDMVVKSGCLLTEPTPKDFAEYKQRSGQRRAAYRTHIGINELPEILDMEYRSQVWNELGQSCLSCGSCSMVCPTCYCFDVNDKVNLGSRSGRRVRSWDSCLFRTHALVAGGENFRADRAARIKYRFYHKLRGFVAEHGKPSCVGCGRCSAICPVEIGMVKVVLKIRGEKNDYSHHATA